jgi:LPXTG-motif cell wall-anchored protein
VSAAQFGLWQARFVREDSLFALFGLLIVSAGAGLLALRRQPTRIGL